MILCLLGRIVSLHHIRLVGWMADVLCRCVDCDNVMVSVISSWCRTRLCSDKVFHGGNDA